MSREGEFLVYCIEIYRFAKSLTGKKAMLLFEKYHIADYVRRYFGALHTTGEKYIIHDIDMYIRSFQSASSLHNG